MVGSVIVVGVVVFVVVSIFYVGWLVGGWVLFLG